MRDLAKFSIATAGLCAVLLTGCTSDDSADDASATKSSTPTTSTVAESPSAAAPSSTTLDGGWLGDSDVDRTAMIIQGKKVMLAFQSTDGKKRQACEGLLQQEQSILLKCVDKSQDRVKGTIEIASGEKIAIAWTSGKKDVLTKSGNGELDFSQWGLPSPPTAG
ncbi:hypothetical protein AB0L99_01965 [Streptomyces sp. NPDC051954]|uniref:hypothetical protein n=1 Tax=Streptomyces sp. NPDC051954 TaxID=3155524 RepID=UPI00343AD3EC